MTALKQGNYEPSVEKELKGILYACVPKKTHPVNIL